MGILKDMADGDEAEQKVILLLRDCGFTAIKNIDPKTRSFWDIEFGDMGHTIEVKNDRYALKSGNIAVEIFNPKSMKPSGLTITQADYWVFIVGEEIWLTKTETLRKFVNDEKPHRIIDAGGDKNATLTLYKKEHIFTIFTRIDNIDIKETIGLLC